MLISIVYKSFGQIVALRTDSKYSVLDLFVPPDTSVACDKNERQAYNRKMLLCFRLWIGDSVLVFPDQTSHDNFRRDYREIAEKAPKNHTIILACVDDCLVTVTEIPNAFRESPLQPVLQMIETLKKSQRSIDELINRTKASYGKPSIATPEQIAHAHYLYDGRTGYLHRKDCPSCPQTGDFYAYENINKAVGTFPKLCQCVRQEYMQALRVRNEKTISKMRFNYLFSGNSGVLHTPTCSRLLNAHHICGIDDYDTAMQRRYVPCKICRPRSLLEQLDLDVPKDMTVKQYNALMLYRFVQEARDNYALWENHTDRYKQILTNSQNAFISGGTGSTVHLRSCTEVYGVEHPKGYMRLSEAITDGCTPCPVCNPSGVSDISAYFPQYDDSPGLDDPEILETLCRRNGYQYSIINNTHIITTEMGRWYVQPGMPITLEHKHLTSISSNRRHKQNVLFLSYRDVFFYIDQHDRNLKKKIAGGYESSKEYG